MPRPKNTEARRAQIIEALLRVMATRGFGGASVQTIAQEAGLTAGLLHYHFRNKLEMLHGLIAHLEERIAKRVEARTPAEADAWERLDALIDAHLALGDDASPEAVMCWVHIGAESLRDESVRDAHADVLRRLRESLRERVDAVIVDEGADLERVDAVTASLLAMILGSYQTALVPGLAPAGFAAAATRRVARDLVRSSGGDDV